MSSTPEIGPAPIMSHPQPAEKKMDSKAAVEVLLDQYEGMKLTSEEGEKSFVWPEGSRPDIAHDKFDFELPVIDLSPVLKLQSLREEIKQSSQGGTKSRTRSGLEKEIQACEATKASVARAIREACEVYGFFQIVNHGFPMEVVDQLSESCRQIFDLPLEERMKIKEQPFPGKPSMPGYTPMKRNTAFTRMNPSYIWNEGLNVELPETFYLGRTEDMANTLWPEEPEKSSKGRLFRSCLEEYGNQSSRMIFVLLHLIAASLGIPADSVKGLLGDKQVRARLRVNHYPVCAHPEMTWGITGHTDPNVITLLHQDEVGGLQIRFKDGTWHGVQPVSGAFVVNCGDYLQAWTNGRFLSAEHRVVANEKTRRLSIAYFAVSGMSCVVSPRPECVDAEHPPRYKPFTRLEYTRALMTLGLGQDRGQLLEKAFGI